MNIEKNVQLAPFTTFHIGGPADFFVRASSVDDLISAVSWARGRGISFFVLGQGANILISDRGFRGLVIKNEADQVTINENIVIAESGTSIADLITKTAELGLSGLEHFAGIPSSLGGALWQNLHFLSADRTSTAYIADVVKSAEILRVDHRLELNDKETVDASYFNFGYDYSTLHNTHDIVLTATLELQSKNTQEIKKIIEENLAWRKEKHPENATKKSAGSVFKKIENHGAGRLIEKAGLKGKGIGGAQISEKHANFIINTGNATAKDVRNLLTLVQTKVKESSGLLLEPEISFIGEW